MLKLDDTLYFSSISYNLHYNDIWRDIYSSCGPDGKFFINISKRLNPCRFVSRNGEWSLPWKQEVVPGFEMPVYDPTFNKTFEQVTDEKALSIAQQIRDGKKFAVMYSGGIDSTVVLSSLIKNLTSEELQSIVVCGGSESMIENPVFWDKFIQNKLTVWDSNKHKYDDLIEAGYTPITADEGDCIFGTLFGLILYNNYDYYISELSTETKMNLKNIKNKISSPDVHYSAYKDLIIRHLDLPIEVSENPDFGRLLYEKYDHNIKTANVPVHSLHDFFWWLIFNVKYLNCSVRGALYFNDRIEWKTAIYSIINWFNDPDYQRWSMVNNNNGEKIHLSPSTYKMAARKYIRSVDNNEWYFHFKTKLESLWNITIRQDLSSVPMDLRPAARYGLTKDFEMMYITDPAVQNFYKHHLQNYKIDWA